MAAMNPILRLRRAFRSMGAEEEEEEAEEAANAIHEEYVGRGFFEARMNQQTAELQAAIAEIRREMAELRNQTLLAIMLAAGLVIGAVDLLIAFLD